MKRVFITSIALITVYIGMAQPTFVNNPFPKTITVTGSASMEIIPDEIYVNVELREYQKKGESKKDLEAIKTQFLQSCKEVGITDADISIASYSGFSNTYYYMRRKKKSPDMQSTITYQVKFISSKLMDDLVEKLDDDATQNFLIVSISHSKITEYRKQLKIKAVQAAKDKGIYLTEGIGEKLGEAITINEPEDNTGSDNNNRTANQAIAYNYMMREKEENKIGMPAVQEVDFKK
jgi:uncharacterized protein YggE